MLLLCAAIYAYAVYVVVSVSAHNGKKADLLTIPISLLMFAAAPLTYMPYYLPLFNIEGVGFRLAGTMFTVVFVFLVMMAAVSREHDSYPFWLAGAHIVFWVAAYPYLFTLLLHTS